jgi:hypothetical protein
MALEATSQADKYQKANERSDQTKYRPAPHVSPPSAPYAGGSFVFIKNMPINWEVDPTPIAKAGKCAEAGHLHLRYSVSRVVGIP